MLCPCSSTQQEVMPLVPRPRSLPCLPPSTSTNSVGPGTLTLTINPMDIIQSDTGASSLRLALEGSLFRDERHDWNTNWKHYLIIFLLIMHWMTGSCVHEGLSHIHSSACTTCHIRSGACRAMFNLRYKLFLTSFASRYIDDYKMTRTLKAWHYMAAFAVYLALLTILIVHVLGIVTPSQTLR